MGVGFLTPQLGLCAEGYDQGFENIEKDIKIRPEDPERNTKERQTSRKRQSGRDIQTFREMSGEGKRETEKYREQRKR